MKNWRAVVYETSYTASAWVKGEMAVAAMLWALGKTNGCSVVSAANAIRRREQILSLVKRCGEVSKLIETDGDLEEWQTPGGNFWIPTGSHVELFYFVSEQSTVLYGRPTGVTVDCGANVGVWTRAALAEGASKVVAVEPEPRNFECLSRNLAKEVASGRVVLCPKGVWDKEDELPMRADPEHCGSASFVCERSVAAASGLKVTTIDNLVSELSLERVDFIKMDIEGAERRAVLGAANTIRLFHPRMAICIYHLPDDPKAVPEAVDSVCSNYHSSVEYSTRPQLVPEIQFFR